MCEATKDQQDGTEPLPSAMSVVKHLSDLAWAEEEPWHLEFLHLNRLLYYVQGESLVIRDKPAFAGHIEAWKSGPIVPSICLISPNAISTICTRTMMNKAPDLSDDDKDFVKTIWDGLKGYSSLGLRDNVRSSIPWTQARVYCGPVERQYNEITHEDMYDFFHMDLQRNL
jgi:uncharacterized phage-associated protein